MSNGLEPISKLAVHLRRQRKKYSEFLEKGDN
jgi:hypothetical protein